MGKDKLMIEEFKQAGSEYTFFQDLALKYLTFYASSIGVVTTAFLGISYHFSSLNITRATSIEKFLVGPFLAICGLSIIIIGIITALTLIKCRTKCIDSIKSMMKIREFFYDNDKTDNIKRYSYYANVAPRYYQIRSSTQGLVIIIVFINAIAYLALSNGGIDKVFTARPNLLSSLLQDFSPLVGLAFVQYMFVFKYLMRKDVVKIQLNFKPDQKIERIKICYNAPRSITNNSFSHKIITRVFYWLIGLPEKWEEKEEFLFMRRGKTHCKEISIENNEKTLWLIAGYYQIVAKSHKDSEKEVYYKPKDLLIFSNIYREYNDGGTIEFKVGDKNTFDSFEVKKTKNFLGNKSRIQRIALCMETKHVVYMVVCCLFTMKPDFCTPLIFSSIAIFILTPKFFVDFWKKSYLCNEKLYPLIKKLINPKNQET